MLLEINPKVQIDAVDNSNEMLKALIRRAGSNVARLRTHHADARSFKPPGAHYDLVVTHFFLDCLTTDEVAAFANRLRPCLSSRTSWVISDFAVPNSWFGRIVAQPLVTALYCAFAVLARIRVFRLPDHRRALASADFVRLGAIPFASGLLFSEIWTTKS